MSFMETLVSLVLISLLMLVICTAHWVAIREAKASYYYVLALYEAKMLAQGLNNVDSNDETKIYDLFQHDIHKMFPQGKLSGNSKEFIIFWGERKSEECKHDKFGNSGCLRFKLDSMV